MKLERSKNSIQNASYGMIYQIITIIMPFAVRTVFIHTLGVEYLGLNSLFSSILTVLNLTELGFSNAIVYCMYKPIAEDDTASIDAYLAFYKKVYIYVGLIILCIGCALTPFLGNFINGDVPSDVNVVTIYIIYLANTTLSYFLFAYLNSLITAFQRNDVLSKINIIISLSMYVLQIIALVVVKNYYAYLILMPIFTIVNNGRTAVVAKKMFPQYKPNGKLLGEQKKEIKQKVSGLFVFRLSYVSRNAFDSIFISMFLGLSDTAIYNNYYYIMNAAVGVTTVLTSSITSGAGNSVALDGSEKNYHDMNRMNFVYMWIACWFTSCLIILYQPFMNLWVGSKLMYSYGCVILFAVYFYSLKMGDIRYIYEQAKGLWWEYRFRSIAEAACNIILNYVLGKLLGVYGIILATILTIVFINYIYGAQVIFKYYFPHKYLIIYFAQQVIYAIATIFICGLSYFLTYSISYSISGLLIRIPICFVLPNFIYFILFRHTKVYRDTMPWITAKLRIRK